MERGTTRPVHPVHRPARRGRQDPGNRAHPHRLPPRVHRGRHPQAQRQAPRVPRRQPPRVRLPARPGHHRRGHAVGHPLHEAPQHQRGAHLALSEPVTLVRTVRRIRHLPDRRDQPGNPRQLEQPRRHPRGNLRPRRRRSLARRMHRPARQHDHARPQPSQRAHLVAGQRILCGRSPQGHERARAPA